MPMFEPNSSGAPASSTTIRTAPRSMLTELQTAVMGYVWKAEPSSAAEPPKVDETADESAMVGAFLGRVEVVPVRGSHLVDITFVSEEPKFSADAVNALIDE